MGTHGEKRYGGASTHLLRWHWTETSGWPNSSRAELLRMDQMAQVGVVQSVQAMSPALRLADGAWRGMAIPAASDGRSVGGRCDERRVSGWAAGRCETGCRLSVDVSWMSCCCRGWERAGGEGRRGAGGLVGRRAGERVS